MICIEQGRRGARIPTPGKWLMICIRLAIGERTSLATGMAPAARLLSSFNKLGIIFEVVSDGPGRSPSKPGETLDSEGKWKHDKAQAWG